MTPERLKRLEQILTEVMGLPAAEQSALLKTLCGDDGSLYDDVMTLLENEGGTTDALLGPPANLSQSYDLEGLSGTCIGVWCLETLLGRGGMGSVWLAFRNDGLYRKKAALKLMHQHLATSQVIARFKRERQILADLEHPNIARLIDGGTTADGRPYLVIEYVDGTTIERYCKQHELSVVACIRIFLKVCSAVAAAHERGVIHRDLKPSNIMVTATGEPKLLDFGIAGLDQAETALTKTGPGPMTPEYASPEQLRGGVATFGCDIYALGLLLLELVSGHRPREWVGGPIAALRGMQAPGSLPKDLAAVLMRALTNESLPGSYSVAAFIGDLDTFLLGQARVTEPAGQQTILPGTTEPSIKTLLVSDLVNSTKLLEALGDEKSAQILAAHDQLARALMSTHQGVEIDKTDGFLLLFERPIHALAYALAYHQAVEALGRERNITLEARVGIHLGEVVFWHNRPEDVAHGAKAMEVEGLAKPVTARLASLAAGRQTLLTQGPFELAKRAAVGNSAFDGLEWLPHGSYQLKGIEKPLMVFEVGLPGFAPLTAPLDSEKAKRSGFLEKDQFDLQHPVGGRIGPYCIEKELHRNDWVITYLAKHDSGELQMSVIIKVAAGAIDEERLQQFRLNRQRLADLRHPHIAMLLGGGSLGDHRPYFIMEYIDGEPIVDWCAAHAPPLSDLVRLFSKVVGTVGFAQQKGIFHGHLKPGNLLVTPLGEPKLLDYAVSPALGIETHPAVAEYAPPEHPLGQAAFEVGDIYSLGLIFLQILTGERPSEWEGSPTQRLGRLMAEGRQRLLKTEEPSDLDPDHAFQTAHEGEGGAERLPENREYLPELLGYVLRTALAAEPVKRYPSAMAMAADLGRIERTFLLSSSAPTQVEHDLVLWNHPDDRDDARILAEHLSSKGQRVWFDAWNVPLGDSPEDALATALEATRIVLVCLGPFQRAPWTRHPALVEALTLWVTNRNFRVLPILLPGATYPLKQSYLPAFLRGRTWATFPHGFEAGAIARLVQGIQGESPGQKGDVEAAICPFRGLEVFREEDQHFFFGRESLVQQMTQYLGDHAFLAVLGPSGSGKSSVVQAGLIPQMREQQHEVVLFTPGARPLEELAFALHALFKTRGNGQTLPPAEELLARFRNAPESLHFIAREWLTEGKRTRLLLVINQFEELFTLTDDAASREKFIKMLCYAADQPTAVISVVLTMRSDFIGHCAPWPDLNTFISEHFVQVGPMTREQLARAIEEPARLAHLRLEPGLLDRILDDVGDASGALPLLQHALLELYEGRRGSLLTLEAYAKIGGIQGALVRRAEAEYEALCSSDRMTLRNMFVLCLVQPGEGAADTRRRATHQELLAVAKHPQAAEVLLARWTGARLLTGAHDPVRGLDVVDVAHEALIQNWPRIDVWMQEGKATRLLLDRLRQQTIAWQEAGHHHDTLLHGLPLQQMEALSLQEGIHLGQAEQDFLGACLAARDQRAADLETARQQELKLAKKRLRRTVLVAGAFVLVLSLGALFSLQARNEAESSRQRADLRRSQADDLIGFMLGDLKKKLDTVGRLDVLTDVGAKVRGYFETLPAQEIEGDILAKQISLLHLIGEVSLKQTDKASALASFDQSLSKAQSLVQRAPERSDWQNLLLLSHYWVATLAFQDKRLEQAELHYAACRDLAENMNRLEPENATWSKERAYAHTNLGAVFKEQGQWQKALAQYETSVALIEALYQRSPEDTALKQELASTLAWLANLARDQADFERALSCFSRANALQQSLAETGGMSAKSRLQGTYRPLAEIRALRGETEQALPLFEEALKINRDLVGFDPQNNKWKVNLAYNELSMAEFYGNRQDWEKAAVSVQKAASLSTELGSEQQLATGQQLRARVHHTQAWILLETHSAQQALPHALQAVAQLEELAKVLFLVQALNRLGKIYARLGDLAQAQKVWERALDLAKPRDERDYAMLSEKAMTYGYLGRQDEALPLMKTLQELGYHDVFYEREVQGIAHQPVPAPAR